ncbi:hypothetical protein PflA506_5141 [Pseudomonas fluorescens A506]|nr:hypothetical protein PflA506_5141 [Pseudomonas fluorescens A506]
MFHLPPIGVCACSSQALSAARSPRVNAQAPANILDGPANLLFAISDATERPSSAVPIIIAHNFGLRNATCGQMAGKLLP